MRTCGVIVSDSSKTNENWEEIKIQKSFPTNMVR